MEKCCINYYHDFSIISPIFAADSGNAMNMDEMFDEVNKGGEIDASAFTSETSRDKFHKRMRDVFVDMDRLNYI